MSIEIAVNAGRICDAIAKIGYEPYTALMDLVDNSVTAKSLKIKVSLNLKQGKSLKSRNSVESYEVIDDGIGMDEQGIINAFSIGSDMAKYGHDSLSKYGLGLKSAGLSLGSRINIISMLNGKLSDRYTFDSEIIKEKNKFEIKKEALSIDEQDQLKLKFTSLSGTIVIIDGCEKVNQASPKSTIEKLKKRLGVTYFSFLTADKPLSILTRSQPFGKEEEFEEVVPKDILFMNSDNFKENYSPDNYDFYSPYLALDENWILQGLESEELPVKIQAVVFPQATLASTKSPLDEDKRKIVSSYEISKDNKGFFIYRNGRLIRWGDTLEGIIGKDDINIRIRLDLTSVHDDVLHVDVTKQRIEIDDENKQKLEVIVKKAITTAKTVRSDCKSFLKTDVGEGSAFTTTLENVAEDDPEEVNTPQDDEYFKRREKNAEKGDQAKIELGNNGEEGFQKIRYSDKVPYGRLWTPYYDAKEGVFVGINKSHPFYENFLSRFPEGSIERIVTEAIIFSSALAERNTSDHFTEINEEVLERIFRKFHKNIDMWMSEWSTENYTLCDE